MANYIIITHGYCQCYFPYVFTYLLFTITWYLWPVYNISTLISNRAANQRVSGNTAGCLYCGFRTVALLMNIFEPTLCRYFESSILTAKPRCCSGVFLLQLITWQKNKGWISEMTSPVLCALPRKNAGTVLRRSASTRRTSYTPIWPNLYWLRRKGEALKHHILMFILVIWHVGVILSCMDKFKLAPYFCRELEEYKEKQDDNQNGGDAAKISSKHVCFFILGTLCN